MGMTDWTTPSLSGPDPNFRADGMRSSLVTAVLDKIRIRGPSAAPLCGAPVGRGLDVHCLQCRDIHRFDRCYECVEYLC
jgi:hypothetical protein